MSNKINLKTLQDRKSAESRTFMWDYENKIVNYRLYDTINNKSYVGTAVNLYQRIYNKRTGHLGSLFSDKRHDFIHLMILSVGIDNFELYIEADYFKTVEEALINEKELIQKYNSFNDGYNMTPDGKGGNLGGIYVTDGKINIRIKPSELPLYVTKGFKKGYNRVVVTDPTTGKFYRKPKEEADKLINNLGWTLGSKLLSTTKGRISVTNPSTGETKKILSSEKSTYLNNGWKTGFGPNKGLKKVIMLDPLGNEVIVREDNVEKYKIQGYSKKK